MQLKKSNWAWHMPAMLGCSTTCPKCKHEFTCCPPLQTCCSVRRSMHVLSGGGLVTTLAAPAGPCTSPQVSPSAPVTFIIPPFAAPLQPATSLSEAKPETELQRLADTVRALRLSGWYYEGMTYQTSHELLKDSKIGTFLVRNSSDPRYLFSLSVQTDRGPTSVRLFYFNGYFRLDAQPHLQSAMPVFPSVVKLVEHYVKQSKLCSNSSQVWVDLQGKLYSSILLTEPLRKIKEPPSLKHLARLTVHKALEDSIRPKITMLPPPHTELELPASLTKYLAEYPHSL